MMGRRNYRNNNRNIAKRWAMAVAIAAAVCIGLWLALDRTGHKGSAPEEVSAEVVPVDTVYRYGLPIEYFAVRYDTVAPRQTLADLLMEHGLTAQKVYALTSHCPDSVFDVRKVRAGQPCLLLADMDSAATPRYFVYEMNAKEYAVFDLTTDRVTRGTLPSAWRERTCGGVVESSLWNAMIASNASPQVAVMLSHIFGWTIDFFGIQKGDHFTVIYDEKLIDTTHVGIGRVWGAKFNHAGKDVYAIPFRQNDKIQYWEFNGASLRKQLLKAPLKFSRISSRFSRSRLHPVHRVYRPHLGVDYAAPTGTPVHAVADGVVTFKGWGGGGGNTLKIKHAGNLVTGYLHLSKFAKGISQGTRVSQGQVIGYVGSTGTSTGPHLDYRIWKNGTNIDPLKVPQEPAEPINKENTAAFEHIRDRIVAELNGEATPEMIVTQLDSIVMPVADTTKMEEVATDTESAEKKKKRR